MAAKGGFFMASHKGDFPYAKMANNMILVSMSEVRHDPKEINLLRQYRRMRQRYMLPDPRSHPAAWRNCPWHVAWLCGLHFNPGLCSVLNPRHDWDYPLAA
jgi:hypothetical protein